MFKLFSIRLNSYSTRYQMSPTDRLVLLFLRYNKIPSKIVTNVTCAETLII